MTRNKVLIGLMIIGVMTLSLPASAHHGRGDAYDTKNPLTLKATVTQLLYVNPHVQLYFDTKDGQGKVTHWNGEMTDIGQLIRAGWTKKRFTEALMPGTPVTVTIQKSKTPLPPGQGVAVVMKIETEKGDVVGLVRRGAGGQE
jgi:Family of unknown function (DUF6152)